MFFFYVRAGIRCPLLKTPKLPRNQTWVNVNIVIINFLYFYIFIFFYFLLVLFGFISIVGNVGGMGGQWQFVPLFIFYYFLLSLLLSLIIFFF